MSVNHNLQIGDYSTDRKKDYMFTLKIKWMRYEYEEPGKEGSLIKTADETTLFIPADEVHVHGVITSMDQMKAWDDGNFFDYAVCVTDRGEIQESRLIQINRKNEPSVWYLASHAWLLGPDGGTIERLV